MSACYSYTIITFVATANAVKNCGGEPIFIDIDPETLGLSASALASFLDENHTYAMMDTVG